MKKLKVYTVFCILVLGYYTNAYPQSSDNQVSHFYSRIESAGDRNTNYQKNSSQQLLRIIEHRRDSTLLLLSDPLTSIRQFSEHLGNNERKTIFYYNQNNIVAIVNRIFDNKSEVKSYKVFYFKENNNCDWYTVKHGKDTNSLTYTLIDRMIVVSDYNETPTILKGAQKAQVIKSAKTSLDSIMSFFPEFKYSFNWR